MWLIAKIKLYSAMTAFGHERSEMFSTHSCKVEKSKYVFSYLFIQNKCESSRKA